MGTSVGHVLDALRRPQLQKHCVFETMAIHSVAIRRQSLSSKHQRWKWRRGVYLLEVYGPYQTICYTFSLCDNATCSSAAEVW